MCVLDAIPHKIFIVFYILHVRDLLQSVLWVFIGDVIAILTVKFLCRSSSQGAGTPGEKTGEVVEMDLAGGLLCGVCMVGSRSARHERCHVFLSMRCTLFPEKQDLQLKRNGNSSGSGISADRKINLF